MESDCFWFLFEEEVCFIRTLFFFVVIHLLLEIPTKSVHGFQMEPLRRTSRNVHQNVKVYLSYNDHDL